MDYIGVCILDLPCTIRGYTKKNIDGSYTILINARLSAEMQITTYDHEVSHINNGDFDSCIYVDSIEYERHRKELY